MQTDAKNFATSCGKKMKPYLITKDGINEFSVWINHLKPNAADINQKQKPIYLACLNKSLKIKGFS